MNNILAPFKFIKTPFQIHFIVRYCIIVLISGFIAGGILFFLTRGVATISVSQARIESLPMIQYLWPWTLRILMISFIISLFLAITIFSVISYRIGIQLIQLRQALYDIRNGNWNTQFPCADNESLKDLFIQLKECMETLKGKNTRLYSSFRELENKSKNNIPLQKSDFEKIHQCLEEYKY